MNSVGVMVRLPSYDFLSGWCDAESSDAPAAAQVPYASPTNDLAEQYAFDSDAEVDVLMKFTPCAELDHGSNSNSNRTSFDVPSISVGNDHSIDATEADAGLFHGEFLSPHNSRQSIVGVSAGTRTSPRTSPRKHGYGPASGLSMFY
jgi:hypothetical protein